MIRFISGLLLVAAIGMGAGVLMAPSTGKQTRKKLGKKSRKLAKKMAALMGKEEETQVARKRSGSTPVAV